MLKHNKTSKDKQYKTYTNDVSSEMSCLSLIHKFIFYFLVFQLLGFKIDLMFLAFKYSSITDHRSHKHKP
ncbi:hypothetical protein MANES_08G146011v8 [Manihot esculenta]|uniref:Uncharacterized protein n=1 Tax=Manihot esculenta TaxID=3983 RepID=A0ACB7HCG3_MANES|nr:hypothetical protein MANES_08G146011v8 [Manihot esculenta]